MRIKDVRMIRRYIKQNRQRSIWQKIVRMMACVVVFCTTYALILPVITLERNYICGLEAHSHSDQCRDGPEPGTFLCAPEILGSHQHTAECFDPDGLLLCGLSDQILHSHEDICYDSDGELRCLLPTVQTHLHTADCYSGEALVCGLLELTDHTHSGECLDEAGALACGLLETQSHLHSENCPVQGESQWICGIPEHTHDDGCIEAQMMFALQAQADTATLELSFSSYSIWNSIDFPNGNYYTCLIGDEVTIRIPDTDASATYCDPEITVTDCEVISVNAPCSQNHSSHTHGSWYSCGFAHEIVVRITGPNATVKCSLPGDNWVQSANSVTIVSSDDPTSTEPTETEPTETEPAETEPTETEPTETEPAETEPTETEPTEPEIVSSRSSHGSQDR